MGCLCSRGTHSHDYVAENHVQKTKKSSKGTARRDQKIATQEECGEGNDVSTRLISSDEREKNVETKGKPGNSQITSVEEGQSRMRMLNRIGSLKRGERGAQVLAGWPSWLTAVAGEAISGWIPRRSESFEKLEKIGQGTYSSVYKARDLETNKIVALKKVRFTNMDPESVRFMAREIIILRRLDHPNVMKLEGMITSRVSGSLYLIFEYMEHDLTGLAALPGIKFSEEQIKCYMQQLIRGLEHCHKKGVLHRDIKGSNLLIDNKGNLKIADFGLATVLEGQALTSRVVTLWYRSPELLLGSTNYGVAVDLWSAGCILAELFAGKPIMPGRTEVEQLHKIFKLCGSPSERYWKKSKLPHATSFKPQQPYKRVVAETFKDFPSSALKLLDVLLATEPDDRGTASSALQSEFFTTKPLPCEPSSLPRYPPSKEFNVKLREEEARRKKGATRKGNEQELAKSSVNHKAAPPPDTKSLLSAATENRAGPNPKRRLEKNGLLIEPASTTRGAKVLCHSGQSTVQSAYIKVMKHREAAGEHEVFVGTRRNQRAYWNTANAARLSKFSNSVAADGGSRLEVITAAAGNSSVWGDDRFGERYRHAAAGESELLLPASNKSSLNKPRVKDYGGKDGNKLQYSGPLVSATGNLEEMLKQHEQQIQHVLRKAAGFDNNKVKTS
ncbi:probable serine/threonine-protein kinase At1g09600 [Prosopis cineraria]|uniref:probable serine/threonine-protein kinase At1g09600 n=1 Tax=Prosopis cineraria TaxID=364024 RepID=UPI00240EF5D0|nr:probable serine/threonine-protein kinase At1g09600 [Prosopis cineraria]